MIIAICNEKGGSGKTNIAVNLACRLSLDGDRVVLIDADPQRSTEVFSNSRTLSKLPQLFSNISKTGDALADEITIQQKNNSVIVIDTGGRDSIESRITMGLADLVIVPTIPSQVDLDVLEKTLENCRYAQAINRKLKVLILCNKVSPNPLLKNDIAEVKNFISNYLETTKSKNVLLMDSLIFERRIYKKIFEDGKTLLEYSGDKNNNAVLELEQFFAELMKIGGGKVSVSLEKMAM